MSEFLYLYRRSQPAISAMSPERSQQTMQKWMAWMKELGEKGHIKDQGHTLEPTGRLVKGKQKTVTDGPFAEAKDIIGGYTIIEARDLEQAVELSKGCPVFEVDGAVEVRPVLKMNL
ncbi:MAG TPA: YciI family protein [Terriglobales bacterium]|nr:YciI family protein [Terriglobales bacterium]